MKVLGCERSWEQILLGRKVPGNESSRAISLQGAKVPGNGAAQGANWPGFYWLIRSWE